MTDKRTNGWTFVIVESLKIFLINNMSSWENESTNNIEKMHKV